MRVVIFWAMCHHSLGHEKKALLNPFPGASFSPPFFPYEIPEDVHFFSQIGHCCIAISPFFQFSSFIVTVI